MHRSNFNRETLEGNKWPKNQLRLEVFRGVFAETVCELKTYGGVLREVRAEYERHFVHMKRDLDFAAEEKNRCLIMQLHTRNTSSFRQPGEKFESVLDASSPKLSVCSFSDSSANSTISSEVCWIRWTSRITKADPQTVPRASRSPPWNTSGRGLNTRKYNTFMRFLKQESRIFAVSLMSVLRFSLGSRGWRRKRRSCWRP